MYNYEAEKHKIFTEDGQVMFLKIRDKAVILLKSAGAFRTERVLSGVCGEGWEMLACLDRLVEIGELRKVKQEGRVAGQHEIYVRA